MFQHGEKGKQAWHGVWVVAFAFEDSSRAELFWSMIRKKEGSHGYTPAMKASEDFIQSNESITETFR